MSPAAVAPVAVVGIDRPSVGVLAPPRNTEASHATYPTIRYFVISFVKLARLPSLPIAVTTSLAFALALGLLLLLLLHPASSTAIHSQVTLQH